MKRLVLILLIGTIALTMAACTAQATPVYAEGAEKDAAVAAAEPFAQHIVDGIQANNYDTFATDLDATMKSAMTQDKFDAMVKMFTDAGALQSRDLVNVQIIKGYYRVNYQLTFEKQVIIMGVVIPSSGTLAVSGLWFK